MLILPVAEHLELVLLPVKEGSQPGCIRKQGVAPTGNIDSLCYRIHVCRNTTALHESSVKGCCRSSDRSISRVLSDGKPSGRSFLSEHDRSCSPAAYPRRLYRGGCSRRLLGLAPAGVYHAGCVATTAVSSYLTFSPLPLARRSVFCGTGRHCI